MPFDWMTFLLGGGALSLMIGMLTLRARVRKVESEAEELDLKNSKSATSILMTNIVEPLKGELDETRKEFNATKREMQRLRYAIRSANGCDYHLQCPVLHQLRESQDDGKGGEEGDDDDGGPDDPGGKAAEDS